MPLMPST